MRNRLTLGTLLAIVAASLAIIPPIVTPVFADIFWQIAEGREILLGHFPSTVPTAIEAGTWIDHEWLFEAVAAAAYDHHAYWLLVALCACASAAIPLLIFRSVRRGGEFDPGAGIAALASAVAMCKYDAIRPLHISAAACALLLYMLRTRKAGLVPYLLLVALWANVHAGVVLAPLLCSVFALAAYLENDRPLAIERSKIAGAALLGSLCSPVSYMLYTYAFMHIGGGDRNTQFIDEWNPFAFHDAVDWLSVGGITAMVAFGWTRKVPLAEKLTAGLMLVLVFHNQRHLAFLAAACAGVAARCISPALALRLPRKSWFEPLAIGVLCAILVVHVPLLLRADVTQYAGNPAKIFQRLQTYEHPVNAYIDYNVAGYASFIGAPYRVLIDSHADCFSLAVFREWQSLKNLEPGWREVLAAQDIRLVVVRKDAPIASALELLPGWTRFASEDRYIAFVNSSNSMRKDAMRSRASDAMPR